MKKTHIVIKEIAPNITECRVIQAKKYMEEKKKNARKNSK